MALYPYPGEARRLMAVSWSQRLQATRSEVDVLAVARDFLATFSPYDLARLPEECRPGRLVDANDINDVAFVLVRCNDQDDGQGTARCIHRLTQFFTHASVRLSELLAPRAPLEYMPGSASPGVERRSRPRA